MLNAQAPRLASSRASPSANLPSLSVAVVAGHVSIGPSCAAVVARRTFSLLTSSTRRFRRSLSEPTRMSRAYLLSCSNAAEYPSCSHRRSRSVRPAEDAHAAHVENCLADHHSSHGLASDETVHGSRTARKLRGHVQQSHQSQHRLEPFRLSVFICLSLSLYNSFSQSTHN